MGCGSVAVPVLPLWVPAPRLHGDDEGCVPGPSPGFPLPVFTGTTVGWGLGSSARPLGSRPRRPLHSRRHTRENGYPGVGVWCRPSSSGFPPARERRWWCKVLAPRLHGDSPVSGYGVTLLRGNDGGGAGMTGGFGETAIPGWTCPPRPWVPAFAGTTVVVQGSRSPSSRGQPRIGVRGDVASRE